MIKIDFKKNYAIGKANTFGSLCVAQDEVFKPIDDDQYKYDHPYWVSNKGQIYSQLSGRSLHQYKNGDSGYVFVKLVQGGKSKDVYVHRLVAHFFVGKPNEGLEVNHINGDKLDNRAANLEWVTRQENSQHYFNIIKPMREGIGNNGAADAE